MKVKKVAQGFYKLEKEGLEIEVQKDPCEPQLDWQMYFKGEYLDTFMTLKGAKEWFKNLNTQEFWANQKEVL